MGGGVGRGETAQRGVREGYGTMGVCDICKQGDGKGGTQPMDASGMLVHDHLEMNGSFNVHQNPR